METSASSLYALWALLAAFAFLVGTAIYVFTRSRKTTPDHVPAASADAMMAVSDAAAAVYEVAKHERMAIVVVAEAAQAPLAWFAQSIVSVVPVYRRSPSGVFDKAEDAKSVGTPPQSLYITKRSYQTYLGWARSMQ